MRSWPATIAIVLVLASSAPALAAKCPAAKLLPTGKRTAAELGCWSQAVGKGAPVDAEARCDRGAVEAE